MSGSDAFHLKFISVYEQLEEKLTKKTKIVYEVHSTSSC